MAAGAFFAKSGNVFSREVVGAASDVFVKLDFDPSFAIVINKTTNSIFLWSPLNGQAGHTSIIDSGAGTTDVATATSTGITSSPGGLTLGSGVQTTSDVVFVTAFR